MMRAATLFNFLIEAMLTGSVMILLLLVVRRLLRRQLGNRLICLAWLLVAVRLLLPLSFPNPMTVSYTHLSLSGRGWPLSASW